MRSRVRQGSVVQDKRDKVWRFYWWEDGKRKSKALGRFATKSAAWKAAKPLRDALEAIPQKEDSDVPTVNTLIEQYKSEKMPKRKDTRRTYESWMRLHISPKWGASPITELQARPVELWLESLPLAPKSRGHYSRDSQFPVEFRNVDSSHSGAGQSNQFGHDQRRVETAQATAKSHGGTIPLACFASPRAARDHRADVRLLWPSHLGMSRPSMVGH